MLEKLSLRPAGHFLIIGFILACGFFSAPVHAAAGKAALVIGNGAYRSAPPLPNPGNDAADIASVLRGLGFEVVEGINLDRNGMADAIGRFARLLSKSEVALIFYAGHGLQIAGKNYLVPVDAKLEHPSDLKFQAVDLDGLLEDMEARKGINLVFLDACRDNPFTRSLTRAMGASRSAAVGNGLAGTQANVGTLIAFATQPNNVAADGNGRNSPFTTALIKHMATPDLEVRAMLTRVRGDVVELTNGKQVPWDHSSLLGDVYLKAAPKAPGGDPAATASANPEVAFWQTIANSRQSADFEAYLKQYPSGVFAALAKLRIAALTAPSAPAPVAGVTAPMPVPLASAPANVALRSFVPAEPEGWSSAIAVRSDESVVATASQKGEIRLWDVHRKALRAVLRLHSDYLKSMKFTPDGRYLISFGGEGKLAVWDVASGRLERSVDAKREYAWGMDVAANGSYVATLADKQIVIWSIPELRQIDTISANDSNDFVVLSADGSIIVTDDWGNNNEQVVIYDRMQKRAIRRIARGKGLYASRAHAIPGTRRVVVSWSDGLLQGIDITTGYVAWERREIDTYPTFAISSDGRYGVTNGYRQFIIWDTANGELIQRIDGSYGQHAPARERLWSTGAPFRSYNLATRERDPEWPLARAATGSAYFIDNGAKVVFQAGSHVARFDISGAAVEANVLVADGHFTPTQGGYAVISPEKQTLLDGATLKPASEQSLKTAIGSNAYVTALAPGGRHAILSRKTGPSKYEYELLNVTEARVIAKLSEKSSCQVFSPAGDRLVNQAADNKIDYRDTSGKVIRTLTVNYREKYDWMSQCAFSPDGNELVLASGKGLFIIYALSSGKTVRSFQVGSDYFYSMRVTPDGRRTIASQKGELVLIDLSNGNIINRYGKGITVRAISPDGRLFVHGSPDMVIQRVDNGDTVAKVHMFSDGSYAMRTATGYTGTPGVERHFVLDTGDRIYPVTEKFQGDFRKATLSAEVARALK